MLTSLNLDKDPRVWMITIYLFMVSALLYFKPALVFEGKRVREFGAGKKTATVFPLWFWIFILAVVSYLVVHYFIEL
jgi:hypothetical protein